MGKCLLHSKDSCGFHGPMVRTSAEEERNLLSRSVLDITEGKSLNGQIASTSEGECGSTLGVCFKGLRSRHRALMGLSHWAAVTAERAACPCRLIFIFGHICIHVRQSPHKRAQLAIPVFASVTCGKTIEKLYFKAFTWSGNLCMVVFNHLASSK